MKFTDRTYCSWKSVDHCNWHTIARLTVGRHWIFAGIWIDKMVRLDSSLVIIQQDNQVEQKLHTNNFANLEITRLYWNGCTFWTLFQDYKLLMLLPVFFSPPSTIYGWNIKTNKKQCTYDMAGAITPNNLQDQVCNFINWKIFLCVVLSHVLNHKKKCLQNAISNMSLFPLLPITPVRESYLFSL